MKQHITPRNTDYSQWYLDIIAAADMAEHSEVKGAMVIKPYGYAIWERLQAVLDQKIKATGHQNLYFPLFIPESYLKREASHVEGFSPELAVVTHAGGKKLDEPLVVRPTSETIMYATFSKWIQSWRDLPLLVNQWANVVRWEMRPRLFLRTTEFLWQEGHTVHATEQEAEEETLKMLDVYKDVSENYLAVPVVAGQKSDAERFAGALRTYCIEGMMQDGKALQMGTSHNLGQNFAKAFDVMFVDKENKKQYAWQTSWGVSTRLIGGLIMAHSDDRGLVLPPEIAPVQAVIIPIWKSDEQQIAVTAVAETVKKNLEDRGVRVHVDARAHESMGTRMYEWEKKGVPLRIEIGPRDLEQQQVMMARRDAEGKEKMTVALNDLIERVPALLSEMQKALFDRAQERMKTMTYEVDDYEEFKKKIDDGGFFLAHWCGDATCEADIKKETKATTRCMPFEQKEEEGKCIKCGKTSHKRIVFAKAY